MGFEFIIRSAIDALGQNDGAGTTMNVIRKSLLTVALVAALSATAHAGSVISDKSYWPSEARQTTQGGTGVSQRDSNSAFAEDRTASRYQSAGGPVTAGSAWRYQGGPKSH